MDDLPDRHGGPGADPLADVPVDDVVEVLLKEAVPVGHPQGLGEPPVDQVVVEGRAGIPLPYLPEIEGEQLHRQVPAGEDGGELAGQQGRVRPGDDEDVPARAVELGAHLGRAAGEGDAAVVVVDADPDRPFVRALPWELLGAANTNLGATDAGSASLVMGPVSGTIDLDEADRVLLGCAEGVFAGTTVAGAGDVNGDGYSDVLVGAPGANLGEAGAGAVFVLFGQPADSDTGPAGGDGSPFG